MSKQLVDRSASLIDAQESLSDKELEERLRSGDHQIMNELPELLQPRLLRRAYQYIRDFRQIVPAYLEAFDLVQEASVVIFKHLEDARTKSSPLGYLIKVGYQTMRYFCLSFLKEPHVLSLDRPCFEDNETPLHEQLPISLLQNSPYEGEDIGKYQALYQAIEQLPEPQRTVIEHAYGLGEHAASSGYRIQRDLKWSGERMRNQKYKALDSLSLALQDVFSHDRKAALLAYIPNGQRERLDQTYTHLQARNPGQQISQRRLRQEAKVDTWVAKVYLQAMENEPQLTQKEQTRQKLDRAYAALQARGEAITGRALQREARADWRTVSAYLRERIEPS